MLSYAHTCTGPKKLFFFRRKKSDNSIVYKRVKTSAPGFSGILLEFSTNQYFWRCTCPLCSTPLNGQRDINLEKVYKKQNIQFFQLSAPAISVASPFHWIIYVVNNNLKNSCLFKSNLSGLSAIGKSRLPVESGLGQDARSHSFR